uniref:Uncharacterized protein n=1 Tax=Lepeophtheirus salmonis TaxID=72036 RepID=A0A0K2T562_LEPSM
MASLFLIILDIVVLASPYSLASSQMRSPSSLRLRMSNFVSREITLRLYLVPISCI